jgi:hypothetical protein
VEKFWKWRLQSVSVLYSSTWVEGNWCTQIGLIVILVKVSPRSYSLNPCLGPTLQSGKSVRTEPTRVMHQYR